MDIEVVTQYLAMGLLGLLGVFLVFGMLFGLGRGLKRSSIRLATVLVALLVTFLVTPFIIKGVSQLNIKICGHTPAGWVDVLVEQMQQSGAAYLTPVLPYLKDFGLALAVAVLNLALFLVLYFVVKMLSWIVYAIIAHCCAPKKDKDGKRLPKHAWWGMLVGAVQGLVLFFFFMIPFNGVIGVVGQVAQYETLGGTQVSGSNQVVAASTDDGEDFDIIDTVKQVDDSLTSYKMVLRFTGMEWLSRQAFNYEMTVRLDHKKEICLGKDLVTGLELAADFQAIQPMVDRVDAALERNGDDLALALAELDANDYDALRYIVNKVFSLELLKFGDMLLTETDQILSNSYNADATVLPGAESWAGNTIYKNSCYAYLIDKYADPAHREEFITGVRAMVNYLAGSTSGLVKQDLLTMLNAMQDLYTAEYRQGEPVNTPVAVALSRQDLTAADRLNILLTTVNDQNDTVLDLILSNLFDLQFFQTLSQPDAENFLLYSNLFDDLAAEQDWPGLGDFLKKFTASFMGKDAIGTREEPGAWWKLRNVAVSVLDVARDHVNFTKDLQAIQDELRTKPGNENATDDELLPKAIMRYLSDLLDENAPAGDDYAKYAKVDRLAVALHDVVFTFDGVADFARQQVTHRFWDKEKEQLNDLGEILTQLLAADDVASWRSLLRSATDLANLLTDNKVIDTLLSVDFSQPDAIQDLLEKVVGTNDEDALLAPREVAEIVHQVLSIPELKETVNKTIEELDLGEYVDETLLQDLMNKDIDEITVALEQVWDQMRESLQAQGA